MPAGLEARCLKILNEIVTISQGIRASALAYANQQNLIAFEKLRRQLELVRISADAIIEVMTRASLTNYAMDDRLTDWLLSGEPRSCVSKLKEMDEILAPIAAQVRPDRARAGPLVPAEDKLATVIIIFDRHADVFRFLLTPNIWNRERLVFQPPQADALPVSEMSHEPQGIQMIQGRRECDKKSILMSNTDQTTATRQRLDEVLRWLAALDCTEKHTSTLRLHQEGTCRWFPDTDAFQMWRTGRNHFLWLHGKAGCGKSVLMASTIEHMKKTLRDGEVVVYFYFDFQNERSMNPSEMMRSLLSQLLGHLRHRGVELGDLPKKILDEKSTGTLSLGNLGRLRDLVSRTSSFFRWEPIIVIDALDECADIDGLLRAVVQSNDGDVRLLVTSRTQEDMARRFAGLQSLSFNDVTKDLAADIELHIERELASENRPRFADAELNSEMSARLNEKAEGRFRWVQCQLDTLKRCKTRVELKEALDNLPNELETTYERILEAIDEGKPEGKFAQRTLAWLVVALEPLRLSQIIDGLSATPGLRKADHQTRWLRGALLNALSSLIFYNKKTDIIVLSHFSVKEYLTKALPPYRVIPHEAHAEVAQTCFRYISAFLKQNSICRDISSSTSFPMLLYVLSSGFNHIAHVHSGSTTFLEALQSLGSDVCHYPSHWDRFSELREEALRWPYPPWPSSRHDFVLYILIAYSRLELFQSFLSTYCLLKPRAGTNPLVYAADLRKTNHAMVLLAYGVDINARGLMVDDSYSAFPLEVAIDLGDDILVGELLRRGCVVEEQVLSTAVCMPWCSSRVLAKLMGTDEFVEWACGIGDEKLYRSVFNSARPNAGDSRRADEDHVVLARRLRQIGQDLSAESRFGAELIERAVHAAHTSMLQLLLPPDRPPHPRFLLAAATGDTSETISVMRFLLGRGVDVNAVTEGGKDTALHLAAMCPWEPRSLELTQLLTSAGCNPHVRNAVRESPLAIAIQHGYLSVVEHLLTFHGSLPSNILSFALRNHSTCEMVRLLVLKGADVHYIASNGDTVLHRVIARYCEPACLDLVKWLVEAGCNPATSNLEGKTVTEAAVKRGFVSVVEHPMSHDDLSPPEILSIALQGGATVQMIQSLILHGADVHYTAPNGDTVLHRAVARYAESTCLILVKVFVEAGVDPSTRNARKKTVLDIAISRGYITLTECLVSYNVPFAPDVLPASMLNGTTLEMVKLLIRKGADVCATTSSGETLLHVVVSRYPDPTALEFIEKFIEAGFNITTNPMNSTVLGVAVKRGFISVAEHLLSCGVHFPHDVMSIALINHAAPKTVEYLIRGGADLNCTTYNGDTILHLTVANYPEATCFNLLQKFIEAGCNPITPDSEGRTVFEAALECHYTWVVERLLLSSVQFPSNILPLALWNRLDPQIIASLVYKGADVHSISEANGDTILHLAVNRYYSQSTCLDLVKTFIEAGCNPATCNSEGKTALQVAIEHKYRTVVEHLLSHKFRVPPDILPIALWHRSTPGVVHVLMCRGADVRSTMSNGDSVLHLAITRYPESTCLDMVAKFMKAGCDPTARDSRGKTAFAVAIERRYITVATHPPLQKALFPSSYSPSSAPLQSTPQMVEHLVRMAIQSSFVPGRNNIFHLAIAEYAEPTCLDLVERFIEAGCDPSAYGFEWRSVLEAAIEREYKSVVEYLLVLHVSKLPSKILRTMLRNHSTPEMIEFTVRQGANVHVTSSDGDNLLHIALGECTELPCLQLVKALVEGGCDPTACGANGETVIEVAMKYGYALVVEYLLSRRIALPPAFEILSKALRRRCSSHIILLLARQCAGDLAVVSTSEYDTLLWMARTWYYGGGRHRVIEILDSARRGRCIAV